MAITDRIAAGEDPESARLAAINEFGNVLQTKEDARAGVARRRRRAGHRRVAGRALRRPHAGQESRLLAGRDRGALARHRRQRRDLQPVQGHRAQAAAGRAQIHRQLAVLLGRTIDGRGIGVSVPDYRDIKAHDRAFDEPDRLDDDLRERRPRRRRRSASWRSSSTGNYFEALGVGAQLGRTLLPSDDVAPGQHPVAVISDSLVAPHLRRRSRRFSARPFTSTASRSPSSASPTPEFNGTVVSMGVDVFAPIMMQPQLSPPEPARRARRVHDDDDRPPQTGRDDRPKRRRKRRCWPRSSMPNIRSRTSRRASTVVPIWQSPFGAQTYWLPAIAVLGGMGLLILLVVCANVANLVLVRGVSRRGELALRVWPSARAGGDLLRLLFVENLVLAHSRRARRRGARVVHPAVHCAAARPVRADAVYLDTSVDGYVLTFALAPVVRVRAGLRLRAGAARPRASISSR